MSDDLDPVVKALTDPQTGGRSSFSVRCGDRNVNLEIATDSDWDPIQVTLGCGYDFVARAAPPGYRDASVLVATRPMGIVLTREGGGDRAAKAEGMVVEWQAGDPAFDDHVYVKADVSEGYVLAAVLNPTVRRATLDLLASGCEVIKLDVDGSISVTLPARQFKNAATALVRSRLDAIIGGFSALIADIPVVRHSGLSHQRPPLSRLTRVLGVVGAGGWLLNVGWAGMVSSASAHFLDKKSADLGILPSLACVAVGLLAGFLGGSLYGRLVLRLARGRSDAHSLMWSAQLSGFGGFSVLAFTVALVLAVALSS